jgi:hypothetical protein
MRVKEKIFRSRAIRELCATVTKHAEESKITVLERLKASSITLLNLVGGQDDPINKVGLKQEWKNDQKNPKKNIISERINSIKPELKKCSNLGV